jgi:thymidylate kinase
MAVQADVARHVIRPALARGCVVIADRFVDTSIAYGGGGYRLGMWRVAKVHELTCGLWPDVSLVLDSAPHRPLSGDRYEREGREFWTLVHSAYNVLSCVYRGVVKLAPGTTASVAAAVSENVHPLVSKLCHPRIV